MKKINSYGLCEKCNRIVKPYYILKDKRITTRCFNHLPNDKKKLAEIHERIKNLKEKLDFKKTLEEIETEVESIKSDLEKLL